MDRVTEEQFLIKPRCLMIKLWEMKTKMPCWTFIRVRINAIVRSVTFIVIVKLTFVVFAQTEYIISFISFVPCATMAFHPRIYLVSIML